VVCSPAGEYAVSCISTTHTRTAEDRCAMSPAEHQHQAAVCIHHVQSEQNVRLPISPRCMAAHGTQTIVTLHEVRSDRDPVASEPLHTWRRSYAAALTPRPAASLLQLAAGAGRRQRTGGSSAPHTKPQADSDDHIAPAHSQQCLSAQGHAHALRGSWENLQQSDRAPPCSSRI